MNVREGLTTLPRTRLAWRLAGQDRGLPAVVFENGWSAAYLQWTLVEPLLAPHTRVLSYDRAGIGASAPDRSDDAASLSQDLVDLLDALTLNEPVVVVGQSYGGLIARLHGVMRPDRVRGVIQLDPTPELGHAQIDKKLAMFRHVGVVSVLAARLNLPNPLFSPLWEHLPEREARLLEQRAYRSPDSLRAAIRELELLTDIRAAIAARAQRARQPRLIVSAGASSEVTGWLARRLINDAQQRQILRTMQSMHRVQASIGAGGVMEIAEAHTHSGLVSTPAGAAFSAARVLSFLRDVGQAA